MFCIAQKFHVSAENLRMHKKSRGVVDFVKTILSRMDAKETGKSFNASNTCYKKNTHSFTVKKQIL